MARKGRKSIAGNIHINKKLFGVIAALIAGALLLVSGSITPSVTSYVESSIYSPINAPVFIPVSQNGYGYGAPLSIDLFGRSSVFAGNLDMLHVRLDGGVTPYTSINLIETGDANATIPLTLSNNGGAINYKFIPDTPGTYSFQAVANDSNGNTALSPVVTVVVTTKGHK